MARIVGYIASSLDGFIATEDDSLDWLFAYDGLDLGEHDYRNFLQGIRTVVMGRRTYDFLEQDAAPWAYGEQRVLVVTSRPISDPKGPLETRNDVDALISELRDLEDGDVWILGGGELQMAFIERHALDGVRRQNIWRNSRRRFAECGPRLRFDVRRRACGVASADVRVSFA